MCVCIHIYIYIYIYIYILCRRLKRFFKNSTYKTRQSKQTLTHTFTCILLHPYTCAHARPCACIICMHLSKHVPRRGHCSIACRCTHPNRSATSSSLYETGRLVALSWITRGTARLDLDPQSYLNPAPTGEAKPLVITDVVSVMSPEAGDEIQLGQRATLKLAGTVKPKLSSVSPAMWIAANARIMATLVDRGDQHMANIKDYMA